MRIADIDFQQAFRTEPKLAVFEKSKVLKEINLSGNWNH
jgi:hypothetical protein